MFRKFYQKLVDWQMQNVKEPLLVTGVRQVGKTWLIRQFCKEQYPDYIYINLESQPEFLSVFEEGLQPEQILRQIGILMGKSVHPQTPIFIDEIQQSEAAINALKYFCEADANYRIIGAGSLLGVKIRRFSSSFPVGKVRIQQLRPMDFEEFLIACGQDALREAIRQSYHKSQPLPEGIHQKAIQLYHDYLFVGGMPQAVQDYVAKGCLVVDFDREIHRNLLFSYAADMTKYTTSAAEGVKINEIYQSIPRQLARENPKFKYKEVRSKANKRDFSSSLDWLGASGLVEVVKKATFPQSPLKAFADDDSFKVYLSDAGLLCAMSGLQYRDLLPSQHSIFKGAVTENYVADALACIESELYYYKPDYSMEIDFLLVRKDGVVPVEVKSGRHKRSTSLKNFMQKWTPPYAMRISEMNFGKMDDLYSIPLYAVFCLDEEM